MLWRALKNVKNGFYVDVGAGRPELDSITKHFYEQGWHGINIEPHSDDYSLLAAARPRDVNLKIAIGPQKGAMTFYENKIRGWSTLDRGTATEMLTLGGDSVEVQVECLPLQEVLDQYSDGPIHFLKIDVEGYEEEVLKSLDLKKSRPWIVVLEAADIHARLPDPSKSFLQLVKNGYEFVYTDALNFFYIGQEKSEELKPHFQKPPNIFDGFVHFNSRDQQQHAQYQDLRNLVCEQKASVEALKAENLASEQQRKAQQEAVATSIGSLKEELAQQQKYQQKANLLDQVLLKGFMVELKETREKEVERGQELRQELEAQKVATSKGVKELGDSLVGLQKDLLAQKVATSKGVKELGDSLVGLKQELEAQKVATSKGVKELGDSLVGLKEELIHELRGLVGGLNERQDQLQQRNLAEMDALRSSLEDRLGKNESHLMDLAKYAEQIQDSVVAPSSYLIPAPFSWYSCLYKMLKIKKPVILNKNKTSGEAPKRPGFWRRLEQSIRKRRKSIIGRIGFDRKWYLQEYPALVSLGVDPLDHYLRFGIEEGRWKSRRHKEKALASGTLREKRPGFFRRLEMSIRKRRKRWTNYWTFDPAWYLEANPDVRAGGIDPLQHYVSFGKKEGRQKREPGKSAGRVLWQALTRACSFMPQAKTSCSLTEIEGPWWILEAKIGRPDGYWGACGLRVRIGGREVHLERSGIDTKGIVSFRHLLKLPLGVCTIRLDWIEEGMPMQKILYKECHVKGASLINQEKILSHPVTGQTDMTVMPKYGFWRGLEKKIRNRKKAISAKFNKKFKPVSSERVKPILTSSESNRKSLVRRLFVDITSIVDSDRLTGVERVTQSVLTGLFASQTHGMEIIPVHSVENQQGFLLAKPTILKKGGWERGPDGEVAVQPLAGDVFLGLVLNPHGICENANLLAQWADEGVSILFYVYDLLPIQYPHFWPLENQIDILHHEWLSIATSFDEVICISETTARRCREFIEGKYPPRFHYKSRLNRAPERLLPQKAKISSIHLGSDFDAELLSRGLPEDAEKLLAKFRAKRTFLMVGTLEPRKGHRQILEVFEELWRQREDAQLVIVGRNGWLMEDFAERLEKHPEKGKKLFWLTEVSDEFLLKIYEACSCLLAASIDEGFGLPVLEAVGRGKPILVRDIEAFREIAGEGNFYFKKNFKEIAKRILDWDASEEKCIKLKAKTSKWNEHLQKTIEKVVYYTKNFSTQTFPNNIETASRSTELRDTAIRNTHIKKTVPKNYIRSAAKGNKKLSKSYREIQETSSLSMSQLKVDDLKQIADNL